MRMPARLGSLMLGIAVAGPSLAADPAQVKHGNEVFQYWCATCHGAGVGKPGTLALQAKYKGSMPALLEERTDLTPDVVKYFVRHGVSVMPWFRTTEVSDADLDALAAYLTRNTR